MALITSMEEYVEVIQTVDESGYIITCKNNPKTYDEADILEGMLGEKGEDLIVMKIWIMDLITSQNKEDEFYTFCSYRFNLVDIYGVIVSRKSNSYGDLFKVDDGTGEIDCWQHRNQREIELQELCNSTETSENCFFDELSFNTSECSDPKVSSSTFDRKKASKVEQWLRERTKHDIKKTCLDPGATVQIYGKLNDYRGKRCVKIYNIRRVVDINEETDRRFELIHLYDTVYSKNI